MAKKKLGIYSAMCAVVFLLMCCIAFASVSLSAKAETPEEEPAGNEQITDDGADEYADEGVEPRGLLVNMKISLDGGGGEVWATAKNTFTLGKSIVTVYVELYSSETYQEYYYNMNLEGRKYIYDLNINKSITVSAYTGGVQKYWLARMRYKFDAEDWVAKDTGAFPLDGNGDDIESL